jgi:hypothetical protein
MCRCGVGLGRLKAVQGRESTSLCHGQINVLLMMGAESTRNMQSNFAVNSKDDCLKLHHVGHLINIICCQ